MEKMKKTGKLRKEKKRKCASNMINQKITDKRRRSQTHKFPHLQETSNPNQKKENRLRDQTERSA